MKTKYRKIYLCIYIAKRFYVLLFKAKETFAADTN